MICNSELKPCPFCGERFTISQEPNDNGYVAGMFYIYHDYGPIGSAARLCPLRFERHFDSSDEAVTAWNARADESRHRMEERAAIVAWLRDQDGHGYDTVRADCIEAGAHLK
jgi:hypothetical protein